MSWKPPTRSCSNPRTTRPSLFPVLKFNVGSAVRLASGAIVAGSNQKIRPIPKGCVPSALPFAAAGAQHPDDPIVAAAVVTDSTMSVLDFSPCGGCRQVMLETEDRQGTPIRF